MRNDNHAIKVETTSNLNCSLETQLFSGDSTVGSPFQGQSEICFIYKHCQRYNTPKSGVLSPKELLLSHKLIEKLGIGNKFQPQNPPSTSIEKLSSIARVTSVKSQVSESSCVVDYDWETDWYLCNASELLIKKATLNLFSFNLKTQDSLVLIMQKSTISEQDLCREIF